MRGLEEKVCVVFYYFNLERNFDVLKSKKEPMLFVEQKYKLKQKRNGIKNRKSHKDFQRE